MTSGSPATKPSRPPTQVDFRKHAEYPIILGDSLKDDAAAGDEFVDVRFNWQPKAGLGEFDSVLTSVEDGYQLKAIESSTSTSAYQYSGHERRKRDQMSSYALVFDSKRSVFVLESISRSIDLNLESAASQSKDDVRRRTKLPTGPLDTAGSDGNADINDEQPDSNNPFDFRNFLDEAKEIADKAAGNKSPMPGSRTPMSGFGSPAAGPTRFVPSATQILPKDGQAGRKSKVDQPSRKPKVTQNRKPVRETQKSLSNERISDSDDELSETLVVKETKAPPPPKGHSRNLSDNIGQSPHIVVNDGDLEIDMGSPPPEQKPRKRRIDADAFRSNTGTPVVGQSPRIPVLSRHVEMKDVASPEEDGDIEELELGSPRDERGPSRRTTSFDKPPRKPEPESAPTPPHQNMSEDDEVAELEDLLGGDDDLDTSATGHGLGISGTVQQDEDSEVSEEE